MNTERSSPRRPKKSCEQCYRRKVRCHGRCPGCEPCQRLGFACSFVENNSAEGDQPRKLRGGNACLQCRKQKSRCNQGIPQCSHCVMKKWTCIYASTSNTEALSLEIQNVRWNLAPDRVAAPSSMETQTPGDSGDFIHVEQSVPQQQNESLPESPATVGPDAFTSNLIDDFFTLLHSVPCFSFLHPTTTKERLMEGSLDEALVLAICGITDFKRRLDPEARNRSLAWISKSEELIWQRLESPSMARLQALILCVAYRADTGSSHRAFMLAGLAARSATAMRLNHERQDLDQVSNEVRRRTLWSLKVLEQYFSIGLPEYELLPFENIYLQLPSREDRFQEAAPSLHLEGGAYSLFIKLTSLRRDIMKFNRSIALFDHPFPQLLKLTRSLDSELRHLRDQMPAGSTMAATSVIPFTSTPWLARHLSMQLSWHQCRCDLYRLLLPGYPEAAPALVLADLDTDTTENAIQICSKSALSIVEILSEANSHCPHSPVLDYDAAICGYHACRLVLFLAGSQSGVSHLSKEYAISRAELCLAAIKRFFRYSAPVGPMLQDLERLISACSTSSDNWVQLIFRSLPTERSRDPLLSEVAMAKQRLAIHSLLRQAEFEDGESSIVVSPSNTSIESSSARYRSHEETYSSADNPVPQSHPAITYVPRPGMEVEQPHLYGDLPTFSSQSMVFPWCQPGPDAAAPQ